MKKLFILCMLFYLQSFDPIFAQFADTLKIQEPDIPILIDRQDNILFKLRIDHSASEEFKQITLVFDENVLLDEIRSVKLYYAGTDAKQRQNSGSYAPVEYISRNSPGQTFQANKSYSILKCEKLVTNRSVVLEANQILFAGSNYFWISIEMKHTAVLTSIIKSNISAAKLGKKSVVIQKTNEPKERRLGIGVRHAGDDGVAAYRIPGLVTTNSGTLLGVYDIRYNNSADLQEYIDIGLSRSVNKGQSWEKMRVAMSFGMFGGLPKAQNGVGDPAILVDKLTGHIWIIAAWTHGMGNQRAWWSSYPGLNKSQTAQLVLSKSEDDGKTWSEPINITHQVKDSSWYFLLQGPGNGISMKDGTLVFPIQFIDANRIPNAGIMYSKDRGVTWKIHNYAKDNTTEAQVVEVTPGVLMLNMRDNRGGSRSIATTNDLGKTWVEHSTSRKALQEPVCMASLIKVEAENNITKKEILLFSNPNTLKDRNMITIKASLDLGKTWLQEHQLLLDEANGWGYSCLSMIDNETVGILYEGSTAHMVFQAIKLRDIIKL